MSLKDYRFDGEEKLELRGMNTGAKKDGVIRGQQMRRDGTVRDTVMYSLIRAEWPPVKAALAARLGLAA